VGFQMPSTPAVLDAPNSASKLLHAKYVDKANRHPCPHCPYRAYSTKTIRDHVRSCHSDEKEFKCPHCTYSSSYEQILHAHLKLHKSADSQPPQNAVAPASIDQEREMPRLKRRPLSNIGNDSSVSQGEDEASQFPPPQRANSAAASLIEEKEEKSRKDASDAESECEERGRTREVGGRRRISSGVPPRKKKEEEEAKEVKEVNEKEIETPVLRRRTRSVERMEEKEGTEEKKEECGLTQSSDEKPGKEEEQRVDQKEIKFLFETRPHGMDCHLDTSFTEDEEEEESDAANNLPILVPKEETDAPFELVKKGKEVRPRNQLTSEDKTRRVHDRRNRSSVDDLRRGRKSAEKIDEKEEEVVKGKRGRTLKERARKEPEL
ncbi:hypothetical protein PENTCL1PPCAC_7490, partial [Pristionchus entomophagus]